MNYIERIDAAAAKIINTCGTADIGIVLGSGLGDLVNALGHVKEINYRDIEGYPLPTTPGHSGVMGVGELGGKRIVAMGGRFHSYEGYDMDDVTMPIRVLKRMGVKTVILTNAAGGVNTSYIPGDLMAITDYINLTGKNPLTGPNLDVFGVRFPDMTHAFDVALSDVAAQAASELGFELKRGVYCWMNGPCYESPAEIRMIRTLGGDAVGMSTVPEVIVARHCDMRVLGISCITNMAAGVRDELMSHQQVMETCALARDRFIALITRLLEKM